MSNGKEKLIVILLNIAALVLGCSLCLAEDRPADNLQIFLEKIRADKKLLVAENMQLTGSEAKAFWPVYEQYQNELFLLRMRSLKLIRDYTPPLKR